MPSAGTQAFRRELLPPPKIFYERELGKLSRPSRGWVKANCPFHSSKSKTSFSVNVESGGFCCFGCDVKGGDIVAFVRLRDRCDFKTACKLLGCWEGVSKAERLTLDNEAARRKREREEATNLKQVERTQRLKLREEIYSLVQIQADLSERLTELLRGVAPAYQDEAEDCWGVLSLTLDDLRATECTYMALIGMEFAG